MLEYLQYDAVKWNPNQSKVISIADLFNDNSMQFIRYTLNKRQMQTTYFIGPFVKAQCCPSGED